MPILSKPVLPIPFRPLALPCLLALTALCAWAVPAAAKDSYPPLDVLLSTGETVIGQQIIYPEGPAKITAALVTLQPGQTTGWHRHDAPLFAYILEGEITVDYGPGGVKAFGVGDSLVEALGSRHKGTCTSDVPVRLLAVFAGAEGVANTVPEKD